MESGDIARAASFDCDEPTLTEWIKKHAWQSHNSGSARVYVCLDPTGNEVAAYYSLSSGAVLQGDVSARVAHGMPASVPILRIGRIGVDRRLKGQGVGRQLVLHAFENARDISEKTGVRAVVVESKPDAIKFYQKLQFFEQSPKIPELFYCMMKDIKKTLNAASTRKP